MKNYLIIIIVLLSSLEVWSQQETPSESEIVISKKHLESLIKVLKDHKIKTGKQVLHYSNTKGYPNTQIYSGLQKNTSDDLTMIERRLALLERFVKQKGAQPALIDSTYYYQKLLADQAYVPQRGYDNTSQDYAALQNELYRIQYQLARLQDDVDDVDRPKSRIVYSQRASDRTPDYSEELRALQRDYNTLVNQYAKADTLYKTKVVNKDTIVVREVRPDKAYEEAFATLQKQMDSLQNSMQKTTIVSESPVDYNLLKTKYGSTIYKIYFDNASSKVKSTYDAVLSEVANNLLQQETLDVLIKGFSSASGNPKYNQQLAQKRAEEIKQVLINRGVHPSRLIPIGNGIDYNRAAGEARRAEVSYIFKR